MSRLKILPRFILLCSTLICFFLGFIHVFEGKHPLIQYLDYITVPIFTLSYLLFIKPKNKLFTLFFITYSLAIVLSIIADIIIINDYFLLDKCDYYTVNGLFIFSYIFLIIYTIKPLNRHLVLKNFKMYLIVLGILAIYFLFVLQDITRTIFTAKNAYYLALSYNTVLILLLIAASLRYFYAYNRKALYILIGCFLIIFSEILEITHFYLNRSFLLKLIPKAFNMLAFCFFYQQSKLNDPKNIQNKVVGNTKI